MTRLRQREHSARARKGLGETFTPEHRGTPW
jgi:hypothetical protein